ncbi:MAG: trigger factor [Candidatus Omnitrophica bacterium]|nr:trigger factor [Candidatus Omnitrophota bacterium]
MTVKATVSKAENCKQVIQIELSPEEVVPRLEEIYKGLVPKAKVSGFRQGKAPLAMVKQVYRRTAEEELLRRVVPEFSYQAIEENEVDAVTSPRVSDVNLKEDQSLSFSAEIEVRPEIKLGAVRGIKLRRPEVEVKSERVDEVLQALREQNSELVNIEDRGAQYDDFALCRAEILVDGKPLHAAEEKWMRLAKVEKTSPEAGSPGDLISQALIGAVAGDEKEIAYTFPAEDPNKELAGKDSVLRIQLRRLALRKLPELNDDFARTVSEQSELSGLREEVLQQLQAEQERRAEHEVKSQLRQQIVEGAKMSAPPSLVAENKERLWKDTIQRFLSSGIGQDQIIQQQKEIDASIEKSATERVKWQFIVAHLAGEQKITASDESVAAKVEHFKEHAHTPQEKELWENWENNHDLVESIRFQLVEDKVFSYLLENAKIVEK